MPKVLHVIARINRGGTARYLENLVPGLQELGWEVLIVTGSVQHGELEDPVVEQLPVKKIKYLGRKVAPIQDVLARRQIKRTIKEFQPDLLHSHTFKAGLLVRTINTKIPKIHSFHGHLLFDPEFRGLKLSIIILIERYLAQATKLFITTGEHVAKELLKQKIGKDNQYISISPSIKKIYLLDSNLAKRKLGIHTDLPIVVWLGRLELVKSPDILVEIAKITPEFFFAVFGTGKMLNELSNHAPENLKFLGWQEARVAWSVADLALSTSTNEGLSNTLLEAKSIGLPIISRRIEANIELLQAYKEKYFANNTPSEFSEALKRAHQNINKTTSMSPTSEQFSLNVSNCYVSLISNSQ